MNKERLILVVDRNEIEILADAIRAIMLNAANNGLGSRTALFKRLYLQVRYQQKQFDQRFVQRVEVGRVTSKKSNLPKKKKSKKDSIDTLIKESVRRSPKL